MTDIAPRLYSIASSLKAHPGEVHLTIGKATTRLRDRVYKGVASTMFADRVTPGATVRVFVQSSHGFAVPANPSAPMIMVGPGTGVAPFRAFLHDRKATGATGRNWLFFGHQRRASDFFYEDELNAMKEEGVLTGLTLAWSRDGKRLPAREHDALLSQMGIHSEHASRPYRDPATGFFHFGSFVKGGVR